MKAFVVAPQGLLVFMENKSLLPHLFRTEYSKITAVLCKRFGLAHMEIAEDIASDTFLQASESWPQQGLPENPAAWLYTVAKHKTLNYLRRNRLFAEKISPALRQQQAGDVFEIDLSGPNIADSQLQMMFAVCHPCIPPEAQVGLALRVLCGFGIEEIADAFLSNKETINKRLFRAREKLRTENVGMECPPPELLTARLSRVLTTLYLLFNKGYYSAHQNGAIRRDLCGEAMRLTHLLVQHGPTDLPPVNALLALMSFQTSRFDARFDDMGHAVRYDDQDESLWDMKLIAQGHYFMERASRGTELSRYHLEAGIAYWHTIKANTTEKWENVLQLYNRLLILEYSPIAALNRTYALSKTAGPEAAIAEAEKLGLEGSLGYHSLLGELYMTVQVQQARHHLEKALSLATAAGDKALLTKKIASLSA
ncbi:RNA polymerase sigma factor [Chitinophaga parva]|nr:DUF6596 domain-containing protein [Chitinophaga parva]